ncbi:hypothetical protein N8I77_011902 [Diaporthe amygdali]|uniref:Uncharacterized protein n=1 Tax=Phomopsis amygdali TaxID=1214568 RepID=A0AAD9S529_PHOAM|nr:hypothetical protein N8I77_011902 [Diaporthe amygdali]
MENMLAAGGAAERERLAATVLQLLWQQILTRGGSKIKTAGSHCQSSERTSRIAHDGRTVSAVKVQRRHGRTHGSAAVGGEVKKDVVHA